jgi:hypothetical protein
MGRIALETDNLAAVRAALRVLNDNRYDSSSKLCEDAYQVLANTKVRNFALHLMCQKRMYVLYRYNPDVIGPLMYAYDCVVETLDEAREEHQDKLGGILMLDANRLARMPSVTYYDDSVYTFSMML